MRKSKQLGVVDGQLAPMPKSPNAVSSQTEVVSKQVESLPMFGDIAQTKQKLITCLAQLGNNEIKSDNETYIYTVFVTPLMRFKDDVEFYIDEVGQRVHFRSASRLGYRDFGANRKRYDAFKAIYLD